jgi:hypothetical protein
VSGSGQSPKGVGEGLVDVVPETVVLGPVDQDPRPVRRRAGLVGDRDLQVEGLAPGLGVRGDQRVPPGPGAGEDVVAIVLLVPDERTDGLHADPLVPVPDLVPGVVVGVGADVPGGDQPGPRRGGGEIRMLPAVAPLDCVDPVRLDRALTGHRPEVQGLEDEPRHTAQRPVVVHVVGLGPPEDRLAHEVVGQERTGRVPGTLEHPLERAVPEEPPPELAHVRGHGTLGRLLQALRPAVDVEGPLVLQPGVDHEPVVELGIDRPRLDVPLRGLHGVGRGGVEIVVLARDADVHQGHVVQDLVLGVEVRRALDDELRIEPGIHEDLRAHVGQHERDLVQEPEILDPEDQRGQLLLLVGEQHVELDAQVGAEPGGGPRDGLRGGGHQRYGGGRDPEDRDPHRLRGELRGDVLDGVEVGVRRCVRREPVGGEVHRRVGVRAGSGAVGAVTRRQGKYITYQDS